MMNESDKQNRYIFSKLAEAERARRDPYKELCAAVLERAYVDYATAYYWLYVDAHSDQNGRTAAAYKRNAKLRFVSKIPPWVQTDADRECFAASLYKRRLEAMRREIVSLTDFFHGDRFQTFAQNISGDWLMKTAERSVRDWASGKRYTWRPAKQPEKEYDKSGLSK